MVVSARPWLNLTCCSCSSTKILRSQGIQIKYHPVQEGYLGTLEFTLVFILICSFPFLFPLPTLISLVIFNLSLSLSLSLEDLRKLHLGLKK